jgi:uncharacterized protein (TIGR01777 family)
MTLKGQQSKQRTKQYVCNLMPNVLISGGTGLIGSEVAAHLTQLGYSIKILTRKPTNESQNLYNWNIEKGQIDPKAWEGTDYVISLAGSSIIGGRWTDKRKKDLINSRVDSTSLLVKTIQENNITIKHFIQASAMGYYGDSGETILTEDSSAGKDFMAKLCVDWENAAKPIGQNAKLSILRIGLYLSKSGGVYATLGKVAKFYIASAFGNGKMYANYTHKDEFAKLIGQLFENKTAPGVYNIVGENPFQMNDFIADIAQNVGAKAWLPNIPTFLLKLALGEMSATLLNSYRVTSPKLNEAKFHIYKTTKDALEAL